MARRRTIDQTDAYPTHRQHKKFSDKMIIKIIGIDSNGLLTDIDPKTGERIFILSLSDNLEDQPA